jgi:hypothetical protein
MKELLSGLVMCFLSILIYFDYLSKFRGIDVYVTKESGSNTWTICNDEEACFGNPNYGFESLKVRSNWVEFTNNREALIKQNFEEFK